MVRRLPCSDERRGDAIELDVGGRTARAFQGESVVAAALASGAKVLSRSLKYHRPRAFFCLEGHCGGCLMRIDGVPNVRACQHAAQAGTVAESQNAYPSADLDVLGAVDFFFPRGMDHHTLMTGSSLLNRVANKVVRQLSGLGKLPEQANRELPPVATYDVDVCVIGGGPAGLAAAAAASKTARVLLIDDQLRLGGSLWTDPRFGAAAVARAIDELNNVVTLPATTAIAFYPEDDGGVLAAASASHLFRVHARQWIWASGGYATNLLFPDNDCPGVVAARAVGRMLTQHAILAGSTIAMVMPPLTNATLDDAADVLTAALAEAGAEVRRIDANSIAGVRGRTWTKGLLLRDDARIDCDLVAVVAVPSPASEGARQQGCAVQLDEARGGFAVVVDGDGRTNVGAVWACGDVCGYVGPLLASAHGAHVGAQAAAAITPRADSFGFAPLPNGGW